jgi:hypothetical protein
VASESESEPEPDPEPEPESESKPEPEPTVSDLPDFDLPTAETKPVFPVPEPDEPIEPADKEDSEPEPKPPLEASGPEEVEGTDSAPAEAPEKPATEALEPEQPADSQPEEEDSEVEHLEAGDAKIEKAGPADSEVDEEIEEIDSGKGEPIEPEPLIEELPFELEKGDAQRDASEETQPAAASEPPATPQMEEPPPPSEPPPRPGDPPSPYAPPIGGRASVPPIGEAAAGPRQPEQEPSAPAKRRRRREAATIPSSTLKQSHIGPLEETDFGDEETSILVKMRGRHWLGWLGLSGVVVIILFFVGRAIYLNWGDEEPTARAIQSVEQLPSQFSGIVRLTPTTERFVTLQISPDSLSPTEFEYKMWTHNAGSTYAETGVGSLNTAQNQILFGEPYGIGGLFVLENGRYRLRSVRRVRFPRWEFTGQRQ